MLTKEEVTRIGIALLLAYSMANRGVAKGSLSRNGGIAAFVVGFVSLACGYRFGAALLSFYYAGTRATRFGASLKKRQEDGYVHEFGCRNAVQVLASSLPGVLFAVLHLLLYRTPTEISSSAPLLAATLQLSVLLFFSACAGDTLASELGSVAATKNPVLLLAPWRSVPAGTNGAVSLPGTLASVLGGATVALAFSMCSGLGKDAPWMPTMLVGSLGGLIGSSIDSILGTIVQASWYDPHTRKILKSPPLPGTDVHKRAQHICGVDLLNGEAVNCLSATLTCLLAPAMISFFTQNE